MKTEEILLIAEHVNLIGPGSRTHDLHDAIERFYRISTEMAVGAEQDAIIDIVAMHGGSIEIEAAIRARNAQQVEAVSALVPLVDADLQDFCIENSFTQDDYTVEVIRAVELRCGIGNNERNQDEEA